MEHISTVLLRLVSASIDIPEYRPPKIESPIENELYKAFRFVGLTVETQFSAGPYRVDMCLSSRLSPSQKLFVECDGAEFHHQIIDDFRDDDLIQLTPYPVAHFPGNWITKASEAIACVVVEKWFPNHKNTIGFIQARENANKQTYDPDDSVSLYPLNPVRSIYPLGYFAVTDSMETGVGFRSGWENNLALRNITRFIVGRTESLSPIEKASFVGANVDVDKIRNNLIDKGIKEINLTNTSLALAYLYLYGVYRSKDRFVDEKQIEELIAFLKISPSKWSQNTPSSGV